MAVTQDFVICMCLIYFCLRVAMKRNEQELLDEADRQAMCNAQPQTKSNTRVVYLSLQMFT